MDYNEACQYLDNCSVFGSKKGHDNLRKLLYLLGDPQDKLRFIHIAGTNGKGSCCAFLSSVLLESGYNVGVFTSPHLIKYNERFSFNGEDISDYEFCRVIENVSAKADSIFEQRGFSFFEILTAAAFCWFSQRQADYVVLEVGLGGSLDSTNIIDKAVLSVITAISFDHTAVLGETIEEISKQKAGIIKKNCPVVLYTQGKKVYNVVREICRENNSRLYYADDYNIEIVSSDFRETVFNAFFNEKMYENIKITMNGGYQVKNACNALMCVEALRNEGLTLKPRDVRKGFEKAFISGRMELVKKDKPYVFLDGAHNEGGCKELCAYIKGLKEKYNIRTAILIGVLADKDFTAMLNELEKCVQAVIITKVDSRRAVPCEMLLECLENKDKCVYYDNDYRRCFEYGLNAGDIDMLICCGSLYLIGDLKRVCSTLAF